MYDYEFNENTVFIVTDFGGEENSEHVSKKIDTIKQACLEIGLEAESAKDFRGGGKIIKKIQKAIENAEFIICDISEPRGYANANVYYEFGYAHGCDNEENDLITICEKQTFERLYKEKKLPFDIQDEHIHKFSDYKELYKVIIDNLSIMKSRSRR